MTKRTFSYRIILLLAASTAPMTAGAQAAEIDRGFQKTMFGHPVGVERAHACFRRVYDRTHLMQHPRQNVRTMTLLVTGDSSGDLYYTMTFKATFRTKAEGIDGSADCHNLAAAQLSGEKGTVVHCDISCDGGSIDVASKDRDAVQITVQNGNALSSGDGHEGEPSNLALSHRQFAADDKVFKLNRTTLNHCLSIAADDDQALMRKGL